MFGGKFARFVWWLKVWHTRKANLKSQRRSTKVESLKQMGRLFVTCPRCTCGGDDLDERILSIYSSIHPSIHRLGLFLLITSKLCHTQLACKQVLWAKVKEYDPLYVPKMVELLGGSLFWSYSWVQSPTWTWAGPNFHVHVGPTLIDKCGTHCLLF